MEQRIPLDERFGRMPFEMKDPWRCIWLGVSTKYLWTFEDIIFCYAQPSEESWTSGIARINNLTLGLLVYFIPKVVSMFLFSNFWLSDR